jgi:hypothetical protein
MRGLGPHSNFCSAVIAWRLERCRDRDRLERGSGVHRDRCRDIGPLAAALSRIRENLPGRRIEHDDGRELWRPLRCDRRDLLLGRALDCSIVRRAGTWSDEGLRQPRRGHLWRRAGGGGRDRRSSSHDCDRPPSRERRSGWTRGEDGGDAQLERRALGHSEGRAWRGERGRDRHELLGVAGRQDARREDRVVGCDLALDAQATGADPDERVAPVDRARHVGECLHEDVAPADVRQLVDDNEPAPLERPVERPVRDHDRRAEEPRNGGGVELGGGSDLDAPPDRSVRRCLDPWRAFDRRRATSDGARPEL